jgi:LemA protein
MYRVSRPFLRGTEGMTTPALTRTGDFAKDTNLYDRSVHSTNLLLDLWWLWLILFGLALIYVWHRNKSSLFNRLEQRCSAAFADIDAILAERHALVPNLVEIARGQSKFELEVLNQVIEAQKAALQAFGSGRLTAETQLGNALNVFTNAAARMPELHTIAEYGRLRQELIRIEEKIAASRRFYNMTVEEYEAVLNTFPNTLVRPGKLQQFDKFSLGERRAELAEPIAISLA